MSRQIDEPKSGTLSAKIVISHATEDYPTAEGLADALLHESLKAWLAKRDVPIGSNWPEEITRAISGADFLVVLLSAKSITSPHVRREVNMAISKGVTLLPVLLESHSNVLETLPDDWNYWLSVVQIVNFTDQRTTAAQIAQQVRIKMPTIAPLEPTPQKPTPLRIVERKSKSAPAKIQKPVEPKASGVKANPPPTAVPNARDVSLRSPKSKTNMYISAGVVSGILVVGAFSLLSGNHSQPETPKNSALSAPSSKVVTSQSASPIKSATPTSSTLKASAKPSPSTTPSAKISSSTKPSPTATTTAKSSPKPSPSDSSVVTPSTLKALAISAGRSLQECVSRTGIAPTGCPFREKTWVQASDVTWSLKGSPHISSAKKVGARYTASVTFTIVDVASYGTMASHTKTQTITRPAVFTRSGSQYVTTWK